MDDEEIKEVRRLLEWIAVSVECVGVTGLVILIVLVAMWICK